MFSNYHPISIISNLAKVLDQTLYAQILHHVKSFINTNQHDFVTRRSTVTNLAASLHEYLSWSHSWCCLYTFQPRIWRYLSLHTIAPTLQPWILLFSSEPDSIIPRKQKQLLRSVHRLWFVWVRGHIREVSILALSFVLSLYDFLPHLRCIVLASWWY